MYHYRRYMSLTLLRNFVIAQQDSKENEYDFVIAQQDSKENEYERNMAELRIAISNGDQVAIAKFAMDRPLVQSIARRIRCDCKPTSRLLSLAMSSGHDASVKFVVENELFSIADVAREVCACTRQMEDDLRKIVKMLYSVDRYRLQSMKGICATIDELARSKRKCEEVDAMWRVLGDLPFVYQNLNDISSIEDWCDHCFATISAQGISVYDAPTIANRLFNSHCGVFDIGPRMTMLFEKSIEVTGKVPIEYLYDRRPSVLDILLRHPSAWSTYCLHDILDECFTFSSLIRLSDGIRVAKKFDITEDFDSLKRIMGANRLTLLLEAANGMDVINITRDQKTENFDKFPALLKYMTSEEIASGKTLLICLKKRNNEKNEAVLTKVHKYHPNAFYLCDGALGLLLRMNDKKNPQNIVSHIKREVVGNIVGTLCMGQACQESPLSFLDTATIRHIMLFLRYC